MKLVFAFCIYAVIGTSSAGNAAGRNPFVGERPVQVSNVNSDLQADLSQPAYIRRGTCRTFSFDGFVCTLALLKNAPAANDTLSTDFNAYVFVADQDATQTHAIINYLIAKYRAHQPIQVEFERPGDNSFWRQNRTVFVSRIPYYELRGVENVFDFKTITRDQPVVDFNASPK